MADRKYEPAERPDRSVKLYKSGGDYRKLGTLYRKNIPRDLWDVYADGYLECTKKLIEIACNGGFDHDTFGYPIFYLFYHYLELKMKEIIQLGRPLIGEDAGYPNSHDLQDLWDQCKKILQIVEGWNSYEDLSPDAKEEYLIMDHFIKEIARDNKAQSFRYPVDKDGNPLLSDGALDVLNIPNLSLVVEWLSDNLDGICTGLSEYLDIHYEMLAEYSNEGY